MQNFLSSHRGKSFAELVDNTLKVCELLRFSHAHCWSMAHGFHQNKKPISTLGPYKDKQICCTSEKPRAKLTEICFNISLGNKLKQSWQKIATIPNIVLIY